MKKHLFLATLYFLFVLTSALAQINGKNGDDEAKAFGAELSKAIRALETGSEEPFAKALDQASAVKDAGEGIDGSEEAYHEAAKAAAEGVARELVRKTHTCGQSKVMRMRREGESLMALVRFDYGDAGWGWADMELAPGLDGRMRIVDIVNYSTGLNLVDTIRLDAAPTLSSEASAAKFFGVSTYFASKLAPFLTALANGEYAEGVSLYYAMDEELKNKRDVAFLALRSAASAGNPISYQKIMKAISVTFADDPRLSYFLAEFWFTADDPAQGLKYIESFERVAGVRDPALIAMKADAFNMMGRPDMGLELARQAIALDPDLQDGHWSALMAHCVSGRYGPAVEEAKVLEERFDYRLDEDTLSKSELYLKLVKSPEYVKWRGVEE